MTERSAAHATFVVIRQYPHSPQRVFRAFSEPDAKAAWFPGQEELTLLERSMDFRPGGRERLSGRWPNGAVSTFDAVYFDIVQDERIVYAYDLYVDGVKISVSLSTVEIKAEAGGTRLTFTEQGAFLDGYDDQGNRERGTAELLDRLGASLSS